MDLVHNIEDTIKKESLLHSGDTIIVAVSGGPDSVALLHVLHQLSFEWNWKLVVAHVNHQFRGEESDLEAELVYEHAEKLQLPCEVGEINVPQYISEQSMNPQAAAREKRYEFLFKIAEQYAAGKIAFAHHADDQAETIIMRVMRGSGSTGLAGIPIRRTENKMELIRPSLRIYKSELVAYCNQHSLKYAQDSSNQERKYFRNQVRLDILPYLQQWNSQLPQTLNRLGQLMQEEDDYLTAETLRLYEQHVREDQKTCCFSRLAYLSIPIALQRRLIKLILGYLSPNTVNMDYHKVDLIRTAVIQQETPSMKLSIYEDISFSKEYDDICFQLGHFEEESKYSVVIDQFPCEVDLGESAGKMGLEIKNHVNKKTQAALRNKNKDEVFLDLDQLVLPITIRSRCHGDRMAIAGLNGSKKVKDIFIDDKIAPSRREKIPIVIDATEQVLWIPGVRFSKHAIISEQTTRVLHMKYSEII